MTRRSKIIGFSLPPEIHQEVEKAIKKKHQTRSEFFRQIIASYFEKEDQPPLPAKETAPVKEKDLAQILKSYWQLKSKSKLKTISGMGTPDILGTYGTFSYYTDSLPENYDDFGGGNVYPVEVKENKIIAKLIGPTNSFRKDGRDSEIPFTIYRDSLSKVAKIIINNKEILLKQGEWSEWVHVKFEMLPPTGPSFVTCKSVTTISPFGVTIVPFTPNR